MKIYKPDKISIVIVNYFNKVLTIKCIESIFNLKTAPYSVVVVDNGSDEYHEIFFEWGKLSKKYRRNQPYLCNNDSIFPDSGDMLIVSGSNDGFSAGNNIGIKAILTRKQKCQGIWLLNNDTELDGYALENICKRMNSGPHVDIVGSTLVNDKNTIQCASGGMVSKITGRTFDIFRGRKVHNFSEKQVKHVEKTLDYVNGASIFIALDVIEKIGLLEENYFLYYEDVDFCVRAKKCNFSLGWAHNSIVYHKIGASAKKSSSIMYYYSTRNRLIFMKKYLNFGKFLSITTLPLFLLSNIIQGNFKNIKILLNVYAELWGKK